MRLSDIKGERTLEVIAEIIDPIANIAEDDKAMELFKKEVLPEGADVKKFLIKKARKTAPYLIKAHKKDIIDILAVIEGVPSDEYKGTLNLVKLFQDCIDLVTDETFITIFISAQNGGGGLSSGSAQENTEDINQ